MRGRRRTVFYVTLLIAVAAAVWWMFRFPYDAQRLYRVIPGDARLVSEHDAPGQRREILASAPLPAGLAVPDGGLPEAAGWLDALLARGASRKVVTGYVPSFGRTGRPGWAFASWVGGYGQWLRWGLFAPWMQDFAPIRLDGGGRGWTRPVGDSGQGLFLSLDVTEGLLLGCVSADPKGVQVLLDRLYRLAPPGPLWNGDDDAPGISRLGDPRIAAIRAAPDRFRFRWEDTGGGGTAMRTAEVALTEVDPDGFRGWILGDAAAVVAPPAEERTDPAAAARRRKALETLAARLNGAPDALVVLPVRHGRDLLARHLGGPGARPADALLGELAADGEGLAFLCGFSGEHSGRLLGLRVPALMAGVTVEDETGALDRLAAALDGVNARYGWGLIPQRRVRGGVEIMVIENTRGGIYGSLGADERPAFAAVEGWLLGCSSAGVLEQVLRDGAAGAAPVWAEGLRRGTEGYAWVDLEAAGAALRKAMAAYALVLLVQDTDGSETARRRLEQIRAWTERLAPLKTAEFRVAEDLPRPAVQFRVGRAAAASNR
ncbi:MAG: hypothetical protein JW951_09485 [Lentisphaerae bacterium]|nr:hypothetical protein [Lentisphaerota bacterium]